MRAGSRRTSLFAHAPALRARTIATQLVETEVRLGAVGPLQREPGGAVELDGHRRVGVGDVERHALKCARRRPVGLNGAMALLDAAAVAAALDTLPGWARAGDEIEKTFERASFADAIAFVVQIGFAAEKADHHPDLDIRWRRVRVALTSHDAGGLTEQRCRARAHDRGVRVAVPLLVALVVILGLLVFMWISIGREPGPGPIDVAIAYEHAWDDLDFPLLYDLSGDELRDGMRRDRFVTVKRAAYAAGDHARRLGAEVTVETSVAGHQTALVVTRVAVDGTAVRNNVMLEHRANGWVVVGYTLGSDAPAS